MPKLPAKEEKLLRFYIQEGATEDKIPVVAARFKQTEAAVRKVLKLKRVQDELEKRMAPMRLEQERQRLVAEAVEQTTAKLMAEKAELEEELRKATEMPRIDVPGNEHIIGQELMNLVRLDGTKYGGVKLAAIKTAYVIAGIMDMGTTKRSIPPESSNPAGGPGIYASHFDRLRELPAAPPAPDPATPPVIDAPPEPEDGVYDLVPSDKPVTPAAPTPANKEIKLPPPGEALTPSKKKADADSRVLTIEVG